MVTARDPPDTPARRRRPGGGRGRMRNEEARRCRFAGGQAQAARRRQLDLLEHADNDGEAMSLEAFFDRVQRFARARRLNDDEARRIKAQVGKARCRWRTEFAGKRPRPTPQHPRCRALGPQRRKRFSPAHREACRKADCRHPICRRSAAARRSGTLHFVNGVCFKPPRQQRVRGGTAKLPAPRLGRSSPVSTLRRRNLGKRRWATTWRMPLEAQDARAQVFDHHRFQRCRKHPGGFDRPCG
jgi:hypothetical protein